MAARRSHVPEANLDFFDRSRVEGRGHRELAGIAAARRLGSGLERAAPAASHSSGRTMMSEPTQNRLDLITKAAQVAKWRGSNSHV